MIEIKNTTIDEDLVITEKVTITGEVIVNKSIIVKENGHLIIRSAELYFGDECGIICEGLFEALNSTFDAKRLEWRNIIITGDGSSGSYFKNCNIKNSQGSIKDLQNLRDKYGLKYDQSSREDMGGALTLNSDVIVDNCQITDCYGYFGGGIYAVKNSVIKNCTISNCKAGNGGGIFLKGSDVTIENIILKECTAGLGGGLFYFTLSYGAKLKIKNIVITKCKANFGKNTRGGGMYLEGRDSNITVENCKIEECSAEDDGGGIYAKRVSIKINDSKILKCKATGYGGGLCVGWAYLESNQYLEIIECSAKNGGSGVYATIEGESQIENCTFIDCGTEVVNFAVCEDPLINLFNCPIMEIYEGQLIELDIPRNRLL